MIVVGYINNSRRKFSKYVTNRTQYILKHTLASQWRYVNTKENPADVASREANPASLKTSIWFSGPNFLKNSSSTSNDINIIIPEDSLPEEMQVKRLKSDVRSQSYFNDRFKKFSSWVRSLVGAIATLKCLLRRNSSPSKTTLIKDAEDFVIKTTQKHFFQDTVTAIHKQNALPTITQKLSPFLDDYGFLRVGGRLKQSALPYSQKHPLLLPKDSHVSHLIVEQAHSDVHHQGRIITHSHLVQSGYHIIGVRSILKRLLKCCIPCKRLRGTPPQVIMSDLPNKRVTEPHPLLTLELMCLDRIKSQADRKGAIRQAPSAGQLFLSVWLAKQFTSR